MKTRTQQIEELQKEWTQPRWEGITRPYSAEDVVKLRGSVNPECTLAQLGAAKMWRLLHFLNVVLHTLALGIGVCQVKHVEP
ncbi:hypothetical protein ACUN9W_06220, partial [Escherichia coli]